MSRVGRDDRSAPSSKLKNLGLRFEVLLVDPKWKVRISLIRCNHHPLYGRLTQVTEDKLITRINALIAKAEGTSNPIEAKLFMGKAQSMMAKHAISQNKLGNQGTNDIVEEVLWLKGKAGQYVPRLKLLANIVANAHGCFMIHSRAYKEDDDGRILRKSNGNPQIWTKLIIFGRDGIAQGVVAMCRSLFADVMSQGSKLKARAHAEDYNDWMSPAANTKNMRAGFIEAYLFEVKDRLDELNRKNDQDLYGGELLPVLLSDSERAGAEAADRYELGKGGGGSLRASNSAAGKAAGKAAGSRADLSGGKTMPATRRAIGAGT